MGPTRTARVTSTTTAASPSPRARRTTGPGVALGAAVLLLVGAGCGGEEVTAPESANTPTEQESPLPTLPSPDGSTTGTGSGGDDAEPATTELTASVGTEADPEAYVISLVDADGTEVTELPAGDYTITVEDPATTHNFRLTGPGGVDEATSVPEVVTTTWDVTLVEGEYDYVCDPHPSMVGGFTVTS
ncbi:cupredoxin domain-containing protein [Pseudokineococcus sp. 1T1Z-3]|uniref:cupredoxin domain-containing protein n=1 Tax=Pseudokineococcus sp. 1T1Z-3 TaxID=3132745 RepID=UPI003096304C